MDKPLHTARTWQPQNARSLARAGGNTPAEGAVSRTAIPPRKGRGALFNPPNRFEHSRREAFDDGWDTLEADLRDLPPLPTTLIRDHSRSAITWNESPDLGFDRSLNPYRGCEHGCIYCYARPSHAYLGFSPGLDFESKLLFKPEVATLLERELRKPGYRVRPLALGTNTDPYQPVERTLRLTGSVLEVLDRFHHPVSIVTKSAGVLRDLDILRALAARRLVRVCLSVTTLDASLARRMEPRASSPQRRLAAIRELAQAGIPTGVMFAPVIPGLNDAELERVLAAAAEAGASFAGYVLVRLPLEVADLFQAWLNAHFPARAQHVLNLIRTLRAGRLNEPRFHHRMKGQGALAELLAQRFDHACQKWGLNGEGLSGLDCSAFRVPLPWDGAELAAKQFVLL
jgi:DNA repair photolyase